MLNICIKYIFTMNIVCVPYRTGKITKLAKQADTAPMLISINLAYAIWKICVSVMC